MADLITVEQFAARTNRSFESGSGELAQLQALIVDASALVVDVVRDATITDDWNADDEGTVPAGVLPVITAMIRRGIDNPHGFTSERSFEYQYQGASDAGVFATDLEARALRRAAGLSSLRAVELEGYMPITRDAGTSWLEGTLE